MRLISLHCRRYRTETAAHPSVVSIGAKDRKGYREIIAACIAAEGGSPLRYHVWTTFPDPEYVTGLRALIADYALAGPSHPCTDQ